MTSFTVQLWWCKSAWITFVVFMQVLQRADTAFYMGMIDMSQRIQVSIMQLRAAQLISEGQ